MFGGSNTVLSAAFREGVSESFSVSSYAIGASSSLQNLAALLENTKEVEESEIVFTESNVNDTHILQNESLAVSRIVEQIHDYYQALAMRNQNVVVIIYPQSKSSLQGRETLENIEKINNAHKIVASRLKFKVIDLHCECKKLCVDDSDILIPDPRHINQALMYNLGKSCGSYFRRHKYQILRDVNKDKQDDYVLITAAELGNNLEVKKNSLFNKTCLKISETQRITMPSKFEGMHIVGIGTWSDSYSALVIDGCIKKPFNSLNAFNELANVVKVNDLTFLSSTFEDGQFTEFSNNVSEERIQGVVKLTSLLLRNNNFNPNFNLSSDRVEEQISLSHLIPKFEPYIKASSFLIAKKPIEYFLNLKLEGVKGKKFLNLSASILRILALKIAKFDEGIARDIMEIALRLNPNALAIKKWLKTREGRNDLV